MADLKFLGCEPTLLHQVVKELSARHVFQHQVPEEVFSVKTTSGSTRQNAGTAEGICSYLLTSISDFRRHHRG